MVKLALYGLILSLFLTCCRKDESPVGITRCFILTGQSNMVGQGLVSELPEEYLIADPRVKVFHDYELKTYKPFGTTFGPELGFVHEILKKYPNDSILIVKMAKGGASIACYDEYWTPDTASKYSLLPLQGNMYDSLLIYIGVSMSLNRRAQLSGVLFLQGPRDIQDSLHAMPYKTKLLSFIKNLRKDLSEPNLPFFIASDRNNGLTPNLDSTFNYKNAFPLKYMVYQAHYTAQFETNNTYFIPLVDLPQHSSDSLNNDHLNTQGQLMLGTLYAQKYQSIYE